MNLRLIAFSELIGLATVAYARDGILPLDIEGEFHARGVDPDKIGFTPTGRPSEGFALLTDICARPTAYRIHDL